MHVLTVDYTAKEAPALFCQSLKETGFAVLRGHPISPDLIERVYAQWRDFFFSNLENKMAYLFERSTQDGYFPFKSENAKDRKISDLKEFFHVYPWGKIPSTLRETTMEMYQALQALAVELLIWIEKDLPKEVAEKLSMPLQEMISNSPNTLLRILHYPPLEKNSEKDAVRAAPHEDINLITLLTAATAPGLEVKDTRGNWHAVNCDVGNIVVNAADMLQMCTQHYYKSTTHRVVNPQGANENCSRFSMPLFLHPRDEVRLSEKYTRKEYLLERLREIGIY